MNVFRCFFSIVFYGCGSVLVCSGCLGWLSGLWLSSCLRFCLVVSLILVVHSSVSVVSSRVIVAHIMWMRRRFASQVIVLKQSSSWLVSLTVLCLLHRTPSQECLRWLREPLRFWRLDCGAHWMNWWAWQAAGPTRGEMEVDARMLGRPPRVTGERKANNIPDEPPDGEHHGDSGIVGSVTRDEGIMVLEREAP